MPAFALRFTSDYSYSSIETCHQWDPVKAKPLYKYRLHSREYKRKERVVRTSSEHISIETEK